MRNRVWLAVGVGIWLGSAAVAAPQEPKPAQEAKPNPLAAVEEKEKRFTQPGQPHKALDRFLGKWTTETRAFIFGQPTQPEKGTAEFSWLMKGRWMKLTWSGQLGGKAGEIFALIGYDNFRQNYVMTTVTSAGTAMARTAGDLNEDGSLFTLFGTVDEYMSDEPDRMMRYFWRFASADKIVYEEHDLQLAENGEKVAETTYTRVK